MKKSNVKKTTNVKDAVDRLTQEKAKFDDGKKVLETRKQQMEKMKSSLNQKVAQAKQNSELLSTLRPNRNIDAAQKRASIMAQMPQRRQINQSAAYIK